MFFQFIVSFWSSFQFSTLGVFSGSKLDVLRIYWRSKVKNDGTCLNKREKQKQNEGTI